jgi:hypothetical protein
MEHELIKIEDYLLVVSDDEIQNKDWFFEKAGKLGPICYTKGKINLHMKKIIAHLPINGAPLLDGVNLISNIENAVTIDSDGGVKGHQGTQGVNGI